MEPAGFLDHFSQPFNIQYMQLMLSAYDQLCPGKRVQLPGYCFTMGAKVVGNLGMSGCG